MDWLKEAKSAGEEVLRVLGEGYWAGEDEEALAHDGAVLCSGDEVLLEKVLFAGKDVDFYEREEEVEGLKEAIKFHRPLSGLNTGFLIVLPRGGEGKVLVEA